MLPRDRIIAPSVYALSDREPPSSRSARRSPRVYYRQPCVTCGRTLRIHVELLGEHVTCQHCGRSFVARDPAASSAESDRQSPLLERANRLLSRLAAPTEAGQQ